MKRRIAISPEVASQILSASSYFEGIQEGLSLEFERETEAVFESIASHPNMYPKEFGIIRRALIRRFHKVVFYTVREEVIVVLEFRDARQAPPDWESRGYRRS